ncbi:MAG: GTP 3',8-cyclase MoaA [Crocinitomicaceae bacterium]
MKATNLIDTFGRKHDYLRISLTEKCNLRCTYCMPAEGIQLRDKSIFMQSEEIIAIAHEFVAMGIKKIRLTGGEPLVKKGIDFILSELGKLPVELSLTTNAILIDKYIDDIQNAGVTSINVSLDSLQADRFNAISRRSSFDRIINNIQLLIDRDFEVKVNVVLMRGVNDDEIIDFIEWSRNEKVEIRFIEFMPFDGNNWNKEQTVSCQDILDRAKLHFGESEIYKIEDGPNDTTRHYKVFGAKGTFGIISTVTNPFCDSCNRIRLTADGKIKNCLFSNDEVDLLSAHRNKESLSDLIQSSILAKKKGLGGMKDFSQQELDSYENRSMIAIGG